ncbi:MAG: DUF3467 domain-containing protein [Actinomycetota bacterium]|nr:DUF3467 domain-containing protein [Actinomycetota bacterium]
MKLPFPGGVIVGPTTPAAYANQMTIGSSQWEFYIDFSFISVEPGQTRPTSRFLQRIIISPQNVKGFSAAIAETVRQYEEAWGTVLPDMREARPRVTPHPKLEPRRDQPR